MWFDTGLAGLFITSTLLHLGEDINYLIVSTYNSGVYVKGSTSSELEVNYYGRLEEVVELQYYSEQNRVFLFKCYWSDTTDKGIRVDPHYGLVEINSKAKLRNVNDVFVFAKQC
jgi:hypothetical protein